MKLGYFEEVLITHNVSEILLHTFSIFLPFSLNVSLLNDVTYDINLDFGY